MNTRLQAGKLRQRIQVVDPSSVFDDAGGQLPAWTPFGPPDWAAVEALTGRELYSAQQVVAEVSHKITMRYRIGISSKQAVQFNDRFFQIQAVLNPDEQTKLLYLLCLERNDSARDAGGTAAKLE